MECGSDVAFMVRVLDLKTGGPGFKLSTFHLKKICCSIVLSPTPLLWFMSCRIWGIGLNVIQKYKIYVLFSLVGDLIPWPINKVITIIVITNSMYNYYIY